MADYFLTIDLEGQAPDNLTAGNINFLNTVTAQVKATPPTKAVNSFEVVARQVIAYLEGGYYNPLYHNTGDSRYSASGETMFGIDKKAGGKVNTTPDGIAFWKKITEAQVTAKWKWNYIPPDPLQTELVNLAVKIIKPQYALYKRTYVTNAEVSALIDKDGQLQFNFIYAVWNGPGWFRAFSKEVIKYYEAGNKTSEALTRFFVNRRINNDKLLGPQQKQNSLIAQNGRKIKALLNIV